MKKFDKNIVFDNTPYMLSKKLYWFYLVRSASDYVPYGCSNSGIVMCLASVYTRNLCLSENVSYIDSLLQKSIAVVKEKGIKSNSVEVLVSQLATDAFWESRVMQKQFLSLSKRAYKKARAACKRAKQRPTVEVASDEIRVYPLG